MKKNKISSVLSDEYLEQVKIMASKERRTLSQMIEIMLMEHIDNMHITKWCKIIYCITW